MGDVVLTEIIEDMDLDRDGYVNLEEYIRDILDDEEHEPELEENEKKNFLENLDKNKDGVLDRKEVIFKCFLTECRICNILGKRLDTPCTV